MCSLHINKTSSFAFEKRELLGLGRRLQWKAQSKDRQESERVESWLEKNVCISRGASWADRSIRPGRRRAMAPLGRSLTPLIHLLHTQSLDTHTKKQTPVPSKHSRLGTRLVLLLLPAACFHPSAFRFPVSLRKAFLVEWSNTLDCKGLLLPRYLFIHLFFFPFFLSLSLSLSLLVY